MMETWLTADGIINLSSIVMTQLNPCTIGLLQVVLISLIFCTAAPERTFAQTSDSLKTGYLADAAEEYWPLSDRDLLTRLGHMPIRSGKGFISLGGSIREQYDRFSNYQWGIGPQDGNGYLLHRVLLHADFRYNKHLRLFTELQSSFISGRNGGARPVQDLNKLAFTQAFAEYSFQAGGRTTLKLRVGEQALHYGVGSLLDIRDANVHRSFAGAKLIMEAGKSKLDIFAMALVKNNPGYFDDRIDPSQKIAGAWFVQRYGNSWINKLDLFYLYTRHEGVVFSQGKGRDERHTLGAGLSLVKDGWSSYTEGDLQLGKFNGANILAWKITQTLGYHFASRLSPNISLQSAMSSGDKNPADGTLQTFNPIYPKAIYYGFIDNAGASNIFIVHLRAGLQPVKKLNLTAGYYRFWRQSLADGIYGPGGNYLLPPANDQRSLGQMFDLLAGYAFSARVGLTAIGTFYNRGGFLRNMPETGHDVWYTGLNATVHF